MSSWLCLWNIEPNIQLRYSVKVNKLSEAFLSYQHQLLRTVINYRYISLSTKPYKYDNCEIDQLGPVTNNKPSSYFNPACHDWV